MSLKFRDRDFEKQPLTRQCTQIFFDPDNEDEKPFHALQAPNHGGALDTVNIVRKTIETGMEHHVVDGRARYIDATQITDFRQAMTIKANADQMFDNLRANLDPDQLKKFDKEFGSQREFLDFALNEDNADKLREMGLIAPLKKPDHLKSDPEGVKTPEDKQDKPERVVLPSV